jgi:hypothetical protein
MGQIMEEQRTVQLGNGMNDFIEIPLDVEDGREVGMVLIDGVFYHFERIKKETLLSEYRVDNDPDYDPQTDAEGYCYILAPFCK